MIGDLLLEGSGSESDGVDLHYDGTRYLLMYRVKPDANGLLPILGMFPPELTPPSESPSDVTDRVGSSGSVMPITDLFYSMEYHPWWNSRRSARIRKSGSVTRFKNRPSYVDLCVCVVVDIHEL